jgi:hypothetical protein
LPGQGIIGDEVASFLLCQVAGRLGAKGCYALLKAQLIADGAWAEERILGKIKAEGGTGIKAEEWREKTFRVGSDMRHLLSRRLINRSRQLRR